MPSLSLAKAGIKPAGSWYMVYEKGRRGTFPPFVTDQKEGLYVIDRATFSFSQKDIKLQVLVEKDTALLNYISLVPVILRNSAR